MVIDLAAGPKARKYRVTYLKAAPAKGWTDEFKTKKLVLRRIEPGTFVMGDNPKDESHRVTLTKPFYMGVFETTQRQWELVMGANPSEAKGETRPVERASYDAIRGAQEGAKWPASAAVDAESFLGRLWARTKLDFDLPTEAQWEYACRAGTTSKFNNGGDTEDDLRKLGRYRANQTERGWRESDADLAKHRPDHAGGFDERHTAVGSYRPNAWGLYDLHGNVCEWCRDWRGDPPAYGTDPVGAASGSHRALRGGCWGSRVRPPTRRRQPERRWRSPPPAHMSWGLRLAGPAHRLPRRDHDRRSGPFGGTGGTPCLCALQAGLPGADLERCTPEKDLKDGRTKGMRVPICPPAHLPTCLGG